MNRPDAPAPSADRSATDAGLHVRRARVADAEAFARTLSHPDVYPHVLQLPYGDADQWRAKLTESCALGKADVILVAEGDGEMVGCAGLHPAGQSPRRRHAMEMGIHVDPAWQGRGVGSLLMQSLCDLADRWLGLLRIELTVYVDNRRAQALYRRFGFEEEGRLRAFALRDGEYVDALAMARLNPQPLRGFPRG
jgi:putative acetyltransferase